jgi:hypothetical protein
MTLACVAGDAEGARFDGGRTAPDDDGASPDAAGAEDAALLDVASHVDGSATDGADANSGGDDEEASTQDATLGGTPDAALEAATDATTSNDATTQPSDAAGAFDAEASSEGGGPCQGLLCSCSGSADCTSGLCVDESAVTQALYQQAGDTSFCTQPCCSSADCSPSTVCFGTGAGGNYCVDPAWLSRSPTLGTLAGGATCTSSAACRSGLCAAGACVDTCCSTVQLGTECVSGATCNLGTFPGAASFDSHRTGFCNASTAACELSPCAACRTSSDCSVVAEVCSYAAVGGTDIGATCELAATGSGAQGTACTSGSTCASGYCDSTSQQCSDVCFTSADCKAGWRCRTELVPIQAGGGNYYVLRCGS